MLHASTVWTSCSVKNIQKVFRLQKHTARLILGADTKGNSVKLNKPILVYKRIPGQCPPYLAQMLVRNVDVNGISSRHGHLNLSAPFYPRSKRRETEGRGSFSVSHNRFRNVLSAHIKNQSTLTRVKKSILKHFMDRQKEVDNFII